jgi:hypothetical protein
MLNFGDVKGKNLWLFTPEEFSHLPDGIRLTCIDGNEVVKGEDDIDQDIRFGVIAFGVHDPETHPMAKEITMALLKAKNATT